MCGVAPRVETTDLWEMHFFMAAEKAMNQKPDCNLSKNNLRVHSPMPPLYRGLNPMGRQKPDSDFVKGAKSDR